MADGLPARFSVGTELLSLDERDLLMPKAPEVLQGQSGGALVVEDDIRDAIAFVVARDGDHRHGQALLHRRVHCNDALHGSRQQEVLVFVDQVRTMMVADDEVEVAFLQQPLLDAAQHQRRVSLTHLWNHHADGEAAPVPELTAEDVRLVVQQLGRGQNALLRRRWNGSRRRCSAEHTRNRCG